MALKRTHRAFRLYLNAQEKNKGNRLYRRNKEEFERLYLEWLATEPVEVAVLGTDTYQKKTFSNGRVQYLKNNKMITKAEYEANS